MVKNGIWLGGVSKQSDLFLPKMCPKKCTWTTMSRIGPVIFSNFMDPKSMEGKYFAWIYVTLLKISFQGYM